MNEAHLVGMRFIQYFPQAELIPFAATTSARKPCFSLEYHQSTGDQSPLVLSLNMLTDKSCDFPIYSGR